MAGEKIKVVVYGSSGYTAAELLRLLAQHPQVKVVGVVSHSNKGATIGSLHPHLTADFTDLKTVGTDAVPACDCVFFATPVGLALQDAPAFIEKGAKVIDLSPDFRIKDAKLWQKWYGATHTQADLLQEAAYGLPELNREAIKKAKLIANPGCYATAIQLALLPLVKKDIYKNIFAETELVMDAKSGVSGAGRKSAEHLLLGEAGEDFTVYAAEGHRHQPEIEESLREASGGTDIKIRFVPHLLPIVRGIFVDAYLPIRKAMQEQGVSTEQLWQEYEKYYSDHPFVRVLPLGKTPRTKNTRGSNFCQIALFAPADSSYLQVCTVLDNLVKGASGQAIQNFNLAFGLPEGAGLGQQPISP